MGGKGLVPKEQHLGNARRWQTLWLNKIKNKLLRMQPEKKRKKRKRHLKKPEKLRKRKLKLPPNRIIYNCNISLDASLVFFLLFTNMANFEMLKSVLTHLDGPILLLKLVIFFK